MNPRHTVMDRDNYLPVIFVLLLVALLPFYAWHQDTSGFLTDDAMYLLLADFFSPFHEGHYLVEHLVITKARFPPAFPVLLGVLGGGSQNMPVAHLVTAGCFLLSAVLLLLWARRILRRADVALACLAVYALLPQTIFYINEIRSEFLFIAQVLGVFLILHASPRSKTHERELLLAAAFLVGLCILTRTIGVALFGAFMVYLYCNRIERKPLYVAVVALLPALWLAIKAINGYSGNYLEDLQQYTDAGGIIKLLSHDLPRNAALMAAGWQEHLTVHGDAEWATRAVSLALLALAAIGFGARLRAGRVDAWYVALYLPPILVWPHPFHIPRLIYPLVPLLLVYVFAGWQAILARFPDRALRAAQIAGVLALLGLVYPSTLNLIDRFFAPVPAYIPEDFRHTRTWLQDRDFDKVHRVVETRHNVITLLKRAKEHVGPLECLYAVHPVSVILYANRRAIMLSSKPVPEKMTFCDYLFVMNLIGEHEANFPLAHVDLDKLRLLDVERNRAGAPQAYLFRIKR